MIAIHGYYNGTVCIPLEKEQLFMNQKVIITALDEKIEPKARKLKHRFLLRKIGV